jgi:hypothetical protein
MRGRDWWGGVAFNLGVSVLPPAALGKERRLELFRFPFVGSSGIRTRLGKRSVWKLARSLAAIFTQIGSERLSHTLDTILVSLKFRNEVDLARYDDILYLVTFKCQYIIHHLL